MVLGRLIDLILSPYFLYLRCTFVCILKKKGVDRERDKGGQGRRYRRYVVDLTTLYDFELSFPLHVTRLRYSNKLLKRSLK